MKVLIVSQYYSPEPVPIPAALAHGLAERGHDVRVLTTFPNYPAGKLAAGYRQKLVHIEKNGDVVVRRVPVFISHSRNAFARLVNYTTFALSSMAAGNFAKNADVVYVYATQMTAAMAPSWWLTRFDVPFVLHIQDLWPESVTGSSMVRKGPISRLIDVGLTPWLRRVYTRAAATIAIGPGMADLLVKRGLAKNRSHTVLNWAPDSTYRSPKAKETPGLTLMYAGNLGEMQDLGTIVRAMAATSDLEDLTLLIVGSGVAEHGVRALAESLGLTNIKFLGRVPQEEMGPLYEASDFQLVTLIDLPIFRVTIPSKLQASLANGVPVITTVGGDVSNLVDANSLGLSSAPGDVAGLERAIRLAHRMSAIDRRAMGQRAAKFYQEAMTQELGINRIETILAEAARNRKRNTRR